jgi:hypothetical protein
VDGTEFVHHTWGTETSCLVAQALTSPANHTMGIESRWIACSLTVKLLATWSFWKSEAVAAMGAGQFESLGFHVPTRLCCSRSLIHCREYGRVRKGILRTPTPLEWCIVATPLGDTTRSKSWARPRNYNIEGHLQRSCVRLSSTIRRGQLLRQHVVLPAQPASSAAPRRDVRRLLQDSPICR